MGNKSNPLLYKAVLVSYVEVGKAVPTNYIGCAWYEEKKIVYSDKTKVIAYVNGYRTEFRIVVYEFHNVPKTDFGIKKLHTYCSQRPHKYVGWLHHVNLYSQTNKTFIKQVKL
jgi:hypothetical protein